MVIGMVVVQNNIKCAHIIANNAVYSKYNIIYILCMLCTYFYAHYTILYK